LKDSSSFDPNFTGTFELNKNLQSKFSKTLELEAFIKILLILFLWREKQFKACL
jgi:hypothetical protein